MGIKVAFAHLRTHTPQAVYRKRVLQVTEEDPLNSTLPLVFFFSSILSSIKAMKLSMTDSFVVKKA